MIKFGIAFGGGGARGIAHLAYLKAMEEAGVKPGIIAGTSSGALVGALYAGGMKLDDIYLIVQELFGDKGNPYHAVKRIKLISGVLVSSAIRRYISELLPRRYFEELEIPLKVVATNLKTLEEKVFAEGNLLDAIMASIAYPRVTGPQAVGGEYYIDGGATNIVPFDRIRRDCKRLAAIDVSMSRPRDVKPNLRNSVHATWAATQNELIKMKLKDSPVEIFERPEFENVSTMDFHKHKYIYEKTQEYIPDFKLKLKKYL